MPKENYDLFNTLRIFRPENFLSRLNLKSALFLMQCNKDLRNLLLTSNWRSFSVEDLHLITKEKLADKIKEPFAALPLIMNQISYARLRFIAKFYYNIAIKKDKEGNLIVIEASEHLVKAAKEEIETRDLEAENYIKKIIIYLILMLLKNRSKKMLKRLIL